MHTLLVLIVAALFFIKSSQQSNIRRSQFRPNLGPTFPITASWFKDRTSNEEWNATLVTFKQQGGDTVILRAPPVIKRSIDDLRRDPNFHWCGSYKSSTGAGSPTCYDEATQELTQMGLKIKAFATYQYEEDFSDAIMMCPKYDRKISSSRKYFRIVLPADGSNYTHFSRSQCNFAPGSEVVVLFTSFAGIDSHQLLLEAASALNVSVYFSLPGVPQGFDPDLVVSYYQWVDRVLLEHKARYTSRMTKASTVDVINPNNRVSNDIRYAKLIHSEYVMPIKKYKVRQSTREYTGSLYDTIVGYSTPDTLCLADDYSLKDFLNMYEALGARVKSMGKRLSVSLSIDLTKSPGGASEDHHVEKFLDIANTRVVDIMMVSESRGQGKGSYYWPHQLNETISSVDPVLDSIIHNRNNSLKANISFTEAFSSSNRDLFLAFQDAKNRLQMNETNIEFWLAVEAFEYLRDDPCLPIDPMASGIGEILNRANQSRVLQALRVASARVQKVIATSWDPDFTCTTKKQKQSLHEEIMGSLKSPLVANCSFHTPHNISVVLLGFNLASYYNVQWVDTRNRTRSDKVYAYYFEMDYGRQHHLVNSLEYTMLYDIPAMVTSLTPTGTIKVTPQGQTESCYFQYDLPYRKK